VITDGWIDGVTRLPGNPEHVNGGINLVWGLFPHSAEGYAGTLLDLAVNGPLSWHMSNLKDGRLIQHFPFTAQCWHATAANNAFVGMEHEGVAGEPLTEAQIVNLVMVIKELAAWREWTPRRPMSATDLKATLYEHREVTRFGGSATACPSGRIPWDEVIRRLTEVEMPKEHEPGELNHRRAIEGLIYQVMTGTIPVQFIEGREFEGYRLVNKAGDEIDVWADIPEWARPT
jgi:hypothetical protein